jgi:hypothetical protein
VNHHTCSNAFSLTEVTLALGVAAFCLLAVFGLIPVGVQTNRNATSQTAATNMAALVVADLRAAPKTSGAWTGSSPLLCITLGTSKTLYFDSQGQCTGNLAGSVTPCGDPQLPVLQNLYRATITFPATGNLTYAQLKVTWPAAADPATTTPSGSVQMLAALDRN